MREPSQIRDEMIDVAVDPVILKANIKRLFGSVSAMARRIGCARAFVDRRVQTGELTDGMIGRIARLGVDPVELIKRED